MNTLKISLLQYPKSKHFCFQILRGGKRVHSEQTQQQRVRLQTVSVLASKINIFSQNEFVKFYQFANLLPAAIIGCLDYLLIMELIQ